MVSWHLILPQNENFIALNFSATLCPFHGTYHNLLYAIIICVFDSSYMLVFQFSSVQFSRSVVSDSLWPHGMQHARPPCPSSTHGACSNSCPSNWWCPPSVSSSVVPLSSYLKILPSIRVFPDESSNEYWGLISFRMDWLDLLAVQGTLKSLLQHHS